MRKTNSVSSNKLLLFLFSIVLALAIVFGMIPSLTGAEAALNDFNYSKTTGYVTADYECFWDEQFTGNVLDASKWNYQTGYGADEGLWNWGTGETQWYLTNNVVVNNGLTINVKQENYNGRSYTSGRINTRGKIDFEPGMKIETKMKLPEGTGVWPAFWLLPVPVNGSGEKYNEYGIWPRGGEIDIMEARGQNPYQVSHALHFGGETHVYRDKNTYLDEPVSGWHTYGIEWRDDAIEWYVDGQCVWTVNASEWWTSAVSQSENNSAPFDKKFYLIINCAVGGNYVGGTVPGAGYQGEMKVEYVRAWHITETVEDPGPERLAEIWDGSTASGFAGGNGTAVDPYRISNGAELAYLAHVINYYKTDSVNGGKFNSSSKHYIMTNNIYLNDTSFWKNWNENTPDLNTWWPIGTWTYPLAYEYMFAANFNGANFSIYGLYITKDHPNNQFENHQGLFGNCSRGVIKNVTLQQSFIKGKDYIGGIAAIMDSGRIENCYNFGTISGRYNVGGIVGIATGITYYDQIYATVKNCNNYGLISSDNDAGGIVAFAKGAYIENCYNAGDIITHTYAGGIAGRTGNYECVGEVVIKNCYNTGYINGDLAGGIVGYLSGDPVKNTIDVVENCYNAGSVSNIGATNVNLSAGGIAGIVSSTSRITNCYNFGSIGNAGNIGAIIGLVNTGVIVNNCYYFIDNSVASAGTIGTAFDSSGNLYSPVTVGAYTGTSLYQALNAWVTANGNAYNRWGALSGVNDSLPIFGDIYIPDVVHEVRTAADLQKISQHLKGENGYTKFNYSNIVVRLINDIVITDSWSAAGASNAPFAGVFDGQGYTITLPANTNLFDYVTGTVQNLNIAGANADIARIVSPDASIIIYNEKQLIGLRNRVNAGKNYQGFTFKLNNSIVLTSAFGLLTQDNNIGNSNVKPFTGTFDGTGCSIIYPNGNNGSGLFGYAMYATIKNLTVKGNIVANTTVGGIVNYAATGTVIDKCINYCDIRTTYDAGGIAGRSNATIMNCSNKGNITGDHFIGGVAGFLNGACKIINCSNTGTVTTTWAGGGIAGSVYNYPDSYANIVNCYNSGWIISNRTVITSGSYGAIGGIAGEVQSHGIIDILNCYNTGAITKFDGFINFSSIIGYGSIIKPSQNYISAVMSYKDGMFTLVTIENMMAGAFLTTLSTNAASYNKTKAFNEPGADLWKSKGGTPVFSWEADLRLVTITFNTLPVAIGFQTLGIMADLTGGQETMYAVQGQEIKLPKFVFEREGMRIIYWDNGNDLLNTVDSFIASSGENTVLNAVWAPLYGLSFENTEGADMAMPLDGEGNEINYPFKDAAAGEKIYLPMFNETFNGEKPLYWTDGKDKYSEGDEYIMPERPVCFSILYEWDIQEEEEQTQTGTETQEEPAGLNAPEESNAGNNLDGLQTSVRNIVGGNGLTDSERVIVIITIAGGIMMAGVVTGYIVLYKKKKI